ncbi:gamma-glutamyltransferase [Fulvivirga lutimaris]|uniref:gamma-glutamyltransferase n=1 Tax=Fulvivirga lutimaris TaxID=1819566 RepID=UPI0012BD0E39|nr:gamma-glutamyltransferase [Fulvivirga lutimaris]MTI39928.1 gamma-glutamyltransferase [Fulvivirga lutimaris]
MSIRLFALVLLLCLFLNSITTKAQTYSRNGMVVSTSSVASETGRDILKKGGNAIDAAVATAFALAVTHPSAGNIGGGGFLVYMDNEGTATTFDFREKAPLKATDDMFLDENGDVIENSNHFSAKAIGVPGTVAGLYKAHEKFGKLSWQEVVQPAVELASNGFTMNWSLYQSAQYFEGDKERYPQMQGFFSNENGDIVEPGDIWKQTALGNTLSLIRDKGSDGFYKGVVAKKIEAFMKANNGIITKKDLAKYVAIERKPVFGTYKDYQICSMAPPSSGGVTLISMMDMMEQVSFDTLEFNSTAYVHFLAEAMRRAYANRAKHLGDPDFNPDMPIDFLLDKQLAKEQVATIDMQKATKSDSSKFGQMPEGDNTTHLSVMDKDGNAVSLTYTLEYAYGSGMVDKELGFIFNNEMGDFNPKPGVTTTRGQIGTKPNLIEPEKRMLSSMTPVIVAKDGKPYLVIGSPGGRTIINTVFQTVLNVIEFDMEIDDAIEAMKIHHQWLPDRIMYEELLLSPDTREALKSMGHEMISRTRLGQLMGIIYEDGIFKGASDSSSGEGAAVGY